MPNYVPDPTNPGKQIDVIELQSRNPNKALPPVLIKGWLKHDLWTRQQAIQLLAGCLPDNPFSITNPKRYLDGTSDIQLSPLMHPLQGEILASIMTLSNWAGLSEANETKHPQEWLAWVKGKGFTPYWLEYAEANQSAPAAKLEAVTVTPQVKTPQDSAASVGEVLAMVGHGVLFMEVAKLEAVNALQNSPAVNKLFDRLVSLQDQTKTRREPIQRAIEQPTPKGEAGTDTLPAPAVMVEAGTDTRQSSDEKPWLIAQTNDPAPEFPWYTAARYFARQLVKDDSTLLTKRSLLSRKVEQSLNTAGIKKRGGKKAPAATTILKAFANVKLG